MDFKKELMKMIGCFNLCVLNRTIRKYKIDYVKLYKILKGNLPFADKRDYIYSIVSEVIADHWWTYYVDEFYYKKGGWNR